MPTFPRYDSQKNINIPSFPVDKTKSEMFEAVAKPVLSAAQELETKTNELKRYNEKIDASIFAAKRLIDFQNDVNSNPGNWDTYKVIDEFDKIKREASGMISNESDKNEFSKNYDLKTLQSKAEIKISIGKYNIEKAQKNTTDLGLSLYGSTTRNQELDELIEKSKETGIFDDQTAKAEKYNIRKQWAYMDMEAAPQIVKENASEYDFLTVEDRVKLFKDADAFLKVSQAREKQYKIELQADTERAFSEDFVAKQKTYAQLENEINIAELNNDVSKEFASNYRRALKSDKAINAISNADEVSKIVRLGYDVVANYNLKGNYENLLTGVQDVRTYMLKARAEGKLTQEEYVKLDRELLKISKKPIAEATTNMSMFETAGQASEMIDNTLPHYLRNEALREYFYKTSGQDYTEEQGKEIMSRIIDQLKTKERAKTVETINTIDLQPVSMEEPSPMDIEKESARLGIDVNSVIETAASYGISEDEVIRILSLPENEKRAKIQALRQNKQVTGK